MSLKIHVIKKLGDFNLKIDLDVEDHIIGLLGYSGCGKTMTLKMIAGIVTPDSGSIVLNGRTLFDSKQKINLSVQERNIGLMFQSYALFNHMTVYENILVGMKGHDKKGQEEVIKNYLKLLEIENLKDKKPKMLSGG
ncbi:MAG: ATP-binding cassette domain-containing protein, partial [Candidatus Cellulosilyticum pullistercoris]|nr:ATP-binding cassette domain-containing protein [Candidatus Cellulosilyticum pullistercoris]